MTELEDIYRENRQGLYALALSITRIPEEAEDAVHDAIMKLARKGIRPEGNFRAYVYTTVRNTALDKLRYKKRRNEQPESLFVTEQAITETTPEKNIATKERDTHLRKMIDELPDKQKETLVMKIYGGLTFEQIAQALKEPLSTVSSRYARTLKSLKSEVEALV